MARKYHSPIRQQNADETRNRILTAARSLILEQGFERTTVDEIAERAGVSAPTVFSSFGSKRGVVAGLLDKARFGAAWDDAVKRAVAEEDPAARLRQTAAIARVIYDAERAEAAVLQVSPDLAALEAERDETRFEAQRHGVEFLKKKKALALDVDDARAVLWSLTGRGLYHSLVVARGWSPDRYEAWLGDLLVTSLLRA